MRATPWQFLRTAVGGRLREALLALGVCMAIALAAVDRPRFDTGAWQEGTLAGGDLRALVDFEVHDIEATEQRRREAAEAVPQVWEYDRSVAETVQRSLSAAFEVARLGLGELPSSVSEVESEGWTVVGRTPAASRRPIGPSASSAEGAAILQDVQGSLNVALSDVAQESLWQDRFSRETETLLRLVIDEVMSQKVLQDRWQLQQLAGEGVVLITREGENRTELFLEAVSGVVTLSRARDTVTRALRTRAGDRPAYELTALAEIAQKLIRVNFTRSFSEQESRRQIAREAVVPVVDRYYRGRTLLAREGQEIGPRQARAIDSMAALVRDYSWAQGFFSFTFLLLLVVGLIYSFAVRFLPSFRRGFRELAALGGLAVLAAVMSRAAVELGDLAVAISASRAGFAAIPEAAWSLGVPIAGMAMLVRILVNPETALVWSVLGSGVAVLVANGDLDLMVFYFATSVTAAGALSQARERSALLRSGSIVALAAAGLATTMVLVRSTMLEQVSLQFDMRELSWSVLAAVLGGLGSGALALALQPGFEALGFLTEAKLVELSNLDHPLLRDMQLRAPGTYHHSMIVSRLAEAGAEAVGCNALLARVGVYFHDLGKALKPDYFIENQGDRGNPHDKLPPHVSARIIRNHVVEGIEVARRHGIPEPLVDMIPQHHGTSLIRYFYVRAKEQGPVKEEDFRYPGPKPQTKEAGIVMIADGAEAATRSLKIINPVTVRERVQSIINRLVTDEQLDECPLTLADLRIVTEAFTTTLLGIHHHRIEYPKDPSEAQPTGLSISLPGTTRNTLGAVAGKPS